MSLTGDGMKTGIDFFKGLASGTSLFYCPYESDDDIQAAKDYCRENGLTPDIVQIKIVYKDAQKKEKDFVCVVKI